MAIQVRRGDYDDMNGNNLLDGEFCATTQDDPHTDNGRGLYFKNGTLKRVMLAEDDSEYSRYQLLDTITVDSDTQSVKIIENIDLDLAEYLIVIDGSLTAGYPMIRWGSQSVYAYKNDADNVQQSATIKRLTDSRDYLVSTNQNSTVWRLGAIDDIYYYCGGGDIASGTVIKIYVR